MAALRASILLPIDCDEKGHSALHAGGALWDSEQKHKRGSHHGCSMEMCGVKGRRSHYLEALDPEDPLELVCVTL